MQNIKKKSRMRAAFRKAGVTVIAQKKTSDRAGALEFIRRVGYPVVVKPDSGAGAANTYKLSNSRNLTTSSAPNRRTCPSSWKSSSTGWSSPSMGW